MSHGGFGEGGETLLDGIDKPIGNGAIDEAVVEALRAYPMVNASLSGTDVVYRSDVNVGVAVALEAGLIVPVVRNADELSLRGLARAIHD
ncbi:MAG: 2-oxo acid dehydrogenase subunit E2, partial [Myxococcota bacterium]